MAKRSVVTCEGSLHKNPGTGRITTLELKQKPHASASSYSEISHGGWFWIPKCPMQMIPLLGGMLWNVTRRCLVPCYENALLCQLFVALALQKEGQHLPPKRLWTCHVNPRKSWLPISNLSNLYQSFYSFPTCGSASVWWFAMSTTLSPAAKVSLIRFRFSWPCRWKISFQEETKASC